MPDFDYTRSAATATRLITKFGTTATLRKISQSGDAWAPTNANSDTTVKCVDLMRRERDIQGGLTGETRRTLYIETSGGVAPEKGDRLVIGGDEHEISEVRPLAPGGTVVLWEADLVT